MKNLILSVCTLLSASTAFCQQSNPTSVQDKPTVGMQSYDNYVMRRSDEDRPERIFNLDFSGSKAVEKKQTMGWSPPQLPADVLQAREAAALNQKNEAIRKSKRQKKLGEKAYIFGVAADQDALE